MKQSAAIDKYIAGFPEATQQLLQQIRQTISKEVPEAEEAISYGIPTFKLKGNLVHFAGYKNHIGFYPAPSGLEAFREELSRYEGSKGTVRFPLDQPLPLSLIKRMVAYRKKVNMDKEAGKQSKANGFLQTLSAPARRALEEKGIKTAKQLARYTEAQVSDWHGIGPSSMPRLRNALSEAGLAFKG